MIHGGEPRIVGHLTHRGYVLVVRSDRTVQVMQPPDVTVICTEPSTEAARAVIDGWVDNTDQS